MRGVAEGANTALVNAQWVAKITPYIAMLFTSKSGATTYDFSTDSVAFPGRVLGVDHREETFNDYAVIILEDHDRIIPDLLGYWTEIGYGLTTGGVNEHAHTARMWVKQQQVAWIRGQYTTILQLEGMWAYLGERIALGGDPPYHRQSYTTKTPWFILNDILTGLGFTATLSEDDGIINTVEINFGINNAPYENALHVTRALLDMTYCYMVAKPTLTFETAYPAETAAVDVTYYKDTTPQYTTFEETKGVGIPNKSIIYANWDSEAGTASMITGTAHYAAGTTNYYETYIVGHGYSVASSAEANTRAAIQLYKARSENHSGRVMVRHDIQIELYDKVTIATSE
jgi:hypothetical protein